MLLLLSIHPFAGWRDACRRGDNVGRMEGRVKKDDKDKQGRTRTGAGMDAKGREWEMGGRAEARGRGGDRGSRGKRLNRENRRAEDVQGVG